MVRLLLPFITILSPHGLTNVCEQNRSSCQAAPSQQEHALPEACQV